MKAIVLSCCAAGLIGSAAWGQDGERGRWFESSYGTGSVRQVFVPDRRPGSLNRVFAYEWNADPHALALQTRPVGVRSSTLDAAGNHYYYMRPPEVIYPQKSTYISRSGRYTHSYATDIGLLTSSSDEGLRNTAAHWLGKYGDPAALPYLQIAESQDASETVRSTAAESIVRIEKRYAHRYAVP